MQSRIHLLLICVGEFFWLQHSQASASTACSLCRDAQNITLPYKAVNIPGFSFVKDCQGLAAVVPILQQGTDQCNLVQSIGTLCGCPKPSNACQLCAQGGFYQVQYGSRPLPFLADAFGGIIPTCELVEAGLHSYNDSDPTCSGSRLVFSKYCGCGAEPGSPFTNNSLLNDDKSMCTLCFNVPDGSVPLPDKLIDIVGFPFRTCGALANASMTLFEDTPLVDLNTFAGNMCWMVRQLAVHCGCDPFYGMEDACPICRQEHAYQVPFPDHRVNTVLTSFFLRDMEMSCGVLADLAKQWSATLSGQVAICKALQSIGTKCGCALPPKPTCSFCGRPLPEDMLAQKISDISPYNLVTCGLAEVTSMYMSDGDLLPFGEGGADVKFECRMFKYGGYFCGCNHGLVSFWGADTLGKQLTAIWTQRVTALLSLIGSFAIIFDVFKSKKVKSSLYHKIMLGLSSFDILSSIAWGLGSLPTLSGISNQVGGVDVDLFSGGRNVGFYGAYGNEATCKTQGFLLHLGFTSIFFNCVLSYYYKCCVVDGMRDNHFSYRQSVLLLGTPVVVGVGVALAAVPFIHISPIGCTIDSYHSDKGWVPAILLFYVPYGPAFLYMPMNICYIYWKFRSQVYKSKRYRLKNVIAARRGAVENDEHSLEGNVMLVSRLWRKIKEGFTLKREKEGDIKSQVFWQAFWYVCGFYAAYFVFLVRFAMDGYAQDAYWFYILLSIFTPIQGFFNSFVYFRRRKFECVTVKLRFYQGGMKAMFSICGSCRGWFTREKREQSSSLSGTAAASQPMNSRLGNEGTAKNGFQFSSGGLPPSEMDSVNGVELTKQEVLKQIEQIQSASRSILSSEISEADAVEEGEGKVALAPSVSAEDLDLECCSETCLDVGSSTSCTSIQNDDSSSSRGEGRVMVSFLNSPPSPQGIYDENKDPIRGEEKTEVGQE